MLKFGNTMKEYKEYHDNGQLRKHCYYNEIREAEIERVSCADNGEIMFSNITRVKIEGEYKSYYENGGLNKHGFYKNGKLDGLLKTWYENGKKANLTSYKNDNINRISTGWYKSGKLKYLFFYKNGENFGQCKNINRFSLETEIELELLFGL